MTDPRPPLPAAAPQPVADGALTPVGEPPDPPRPRRTLTVRNYVWIVAAALVLVLGLRYLGPVLTPFLIGAILA